jgi:hypothetical protein
MSQRVTTWLAWLTRTLCVLLVTSAGLLVLLSFSARTLRESGLLSLMLLLLITFPTVGAVVALRHPDIYGIDRVNGAPSTPRVHHRARYVQKQWATPSKAIGLAKRFLQQSATYRNRVGRIMAKEKVAGSSSFGHPPHKTAYRSSCIPNKLADATVSVRTSFLGLLMRRSQVLILLCAHTIALRAARNKQY